MNTKQIIHFCKTFLFNLLWRHYWMAPYLEVSSSPGTDLMKFVAILTMTCRNLCMSSCTHINLEGENIGNLSTWEKLELERNWPILVRGTNPEDQINRKPEDQKMLKNYHTTKNSKNHKTKIEYLAWFTFSQYWQVNWRD